MRARNIKPGFFTNEDLAECDPLARILFVGLWCMASWEGRMEDRPKKIKAALLPFDECDVDALLQTLHDRGLIRRYEVDGGRFIEIPNFIKHQRPHPDEKKRPSKIPAPPKTRSSQAKKNKEVAENGECVTDHESPVSGDNLNAASSEPPAADHAPARENNGLIALNPDTCFLNPDTPLPPCGGGAEKPPDPKTQPASRDEAAALAEEFAFVSTRRRPGGGKIYTPAGLGDLAVQVRELIRLGVTVDAIRREINQPVRNRNEWFGDMEKRLLLAAGVGNGGGHGRAVGPDSRIHAKPGKYDGIGITVNANDLGPPQRTQTKAPSGPSPPPGPNLSAVACGYSRAGTG